MSRATLAWATVAPLPNLAQTRQVLQQLAQEERGRVDAESAGLFLSENQHLGLNRVLLGHPGRPYFLPKFKIFVRSFNDFSISLSRASESSLDEEIVSVVRQ